MLGLELANGATSLELGEERLTAKTLKYNWPLTC